MLGVALKGVTKFGNILDTEAHGQLLLKLVICALYYKTFYGRYLRIFVIS
jgi:hypothetical protein